MPTKTLLQEIGKTDIYLVDQILKGRYRSGEKILDAGCGGGRNCYWFIKNGFDIYGVDKNTQNIENLIDENNHLKNNFTVNSLEKTSFENNYFDHIICNAVLHFATNTNHFNQMLTELVRILKPKGSLFIRMTSDIGIEDHIKEIGEGKYLIPDGSERFLLKRQLLDNLLEEQQLTLLEPLKTVNVADVRCMSTLVLSKK